MTVTSISGVIPFINKNFSIDMKGNKNIVIIGDNGSGKTSILNDMDKYFKTIFSLNTGMVMDELNRDISNYKRWAEEANEAKDRAKYFQYKSRLETLIERKKEYEFFVEVKIDDIDQMVENSYYKRFFYFYFRSSRSISVSESNSATSVNEIRKSWLEEDHFRIINRNMNNDLESYIISLYTQEALQLKNKNHDKANSLSRWIFSLEGLMTSLMECNIKFEFNYESYKLYIIRENIYKSSFRELSSGYSSVLDVFTEIFIRASIHSIEPHDIEGIILIDEIDEHLHLSIQRKVLPLLIETFPKIQFIITTHSPFVLGSSDEFLIFDISKNTDIPELTMYSYENIVKNVMDVDIIPNDLSKKIKKIKLIISSNEIEKKELDELLSDVEKSITSLDSESKAIYFSALNISMGR